MTERMESVSKNDAQSKSTDRQPNIIGNEEEKSHLPKVPKFNFADYVLPEETKKSAQNERLTLEQFTRKVSSKKYVRAQGKAARLRRAREARWGATGCEGGAPRAAVRMPCGKL